MLKGLRIIGGQLRGKRLQAVSGHETRPTGNRQREAIFNILRSQISDANVLDLFAGTGLLGIEALSRGAKFAVFVDHSNEAVSVIEKNLKSCRLQHKAKIIRVNLVEGLSCLTSIPSRFDIVLMDPPYNRGAIQPVLAHLQKTDRLKPDCTIVIEHSPDEAISTEDTPFLQTDQRQYGKTLVTFLSYMV